MARLASRHYARTRALALTAGEDSDMALRASITHALLPSADAVEAYLEFGVNHSTSKKDARAWEMWEVVCGMLDTNPLRTAKDARDRPERNAHLLAVLMFHAVSVCKPRATGRRWIKPNSALAYPLAIIRIFSRWSIPMPGYKMLKAAAAGLARDYVRYHGPHSLACPRTRRAHEVFYGPRHLRHPHGRKNGLQLHLDGYQSRGLRISSTGTRTYVLRPQAR